jgi:glycosyltransferase involved in cell wall biosynthesis
VTPGKSSKSAVMSPQISVVIPTYNNAALLCETLDGVRRQTFKDFEIIVVDDGSKDNTGDVVATYDPTIHYLQQTNQGPAAARNKGVSLAQGEFIAFCDHDDIWNERHLEKLLGCFITHPSAAMVFDDAQYCGDGIAEEKTHIDAKVLQSLVGKEVPIRRIWQCWVASMSVVMVRKPVFEKLGGLHPGIWGLDDLHFYLRLGAHHEVRFADYVGCKKRIKSNNLLPQAALDGLIRCLEDLKQNHPDVMRAVGPLKVRMRLARRYRKLAERHLKNGQRDLARATYLKAYKENCLNLCDLWSYLFRARAKKNLVCHGI